MSKLLDNPCICFVCRRRSSGFGVGDTPHSIGWLCVACGPTLGRRLFDMRTVEFDRYEQDAVKIAVPRIAAYLDRIGKTDLADMDEAEAEGLVEAIVKAFGDAMREATVTLNPPF